VPSGLYEASAGFERKEEEDTGSAWDRFPCGLHHLWDLISDSFTLRDRALIANSLFNAML